MISILIPTYNYDVCLLVENIFNQCVKSEIEFEIIVCDDCSEDEIIVEKNAEILKFQNVFLFQNQNNLGRTQTRQLLAEKSRYDWFLFLDSDVVPAQENFVANYLKVLQTGYKVILGGYSYQKSNVDSTNILRWKYGVEREEVKAELRSKNPYGFVFSGNILIKKEMFFQINFERNLNLYGMDILLAYRLFINKIKVYHIDNNIIHLGLENNQIFFEKSLKSVKSRKIIMSDLKDVDKVNSLLKHYKRLKKIKLTGLVTLVFKIAEPFLKRKILNKNPNLFYFDLYRLGYICSIK